MSIKNTIKPKDGFRVVAFDGGLNTKAAVTNLKDNQSPDCQNVVFSDFGAVQSRNGFDVLNTAAIGSAVIDGLHSYVNDSSTARLLAVCNGDVNVLTGTAFTAVTGSTGLFTSGVKAEFNTYKNQAFITNGYQQPYKYNGTEFTRMGVSAPTQTLSVACGGAGVLSGSYQYVYTGVNSNAIESDYGGGSTTLSVTSGENLVSNIPTAPASHGIESWNVYRNTALAEGVYYKVTSVTNGVTSVTDAVADSSLETLAPTDNGPPRKFQYLANFQKRLWGAGEIANPSYLWYSEVGKPELFPTTNYIEVGDGDGMIITGINIVSNSVVISKSDLQGNSAMYILFTSDSDGLSSPDNWYLIKSDSEWGAESHRAMTAFSNVLTLLNRNGVFAFFGKDTVVTTFDTNLGSLRAEQISLAIEDKIQAFKESLLAGAAAITYKNKIWFAVPETDSSTENDVVYQYDFVRASEESIIKGSWAKFDGHNISDFTIHDGALYGGSSLADGFVYQLDSGLDDNGTAIDTYFKTAPYFGSKGQENMTKVWRYAYMYIATPIAGFLEFQHFDDLADEATDTQQISMSPGGSLWGTFVWGTDNWDPGTDRKRVRVVLRNAVGKYIQFRFRTNGTTLSWKVYNLEVFYNTRSIRD